MLLVEGDCLNPHRVMPRETLAALTDIRTAQKYSETEPKQAHYTNDAPLLTSGLTLPRALEPLTPYLDELNLVFGLSNTIAMGSHSADYGALSSTRSPTRKAGGPTIDHVLGTRLSDGMVFHRLALGVINFPQRSDGTLRTSEITHGTSASGRGRPLPIYVNPESVHRLLFGVASGEGGSEVALRTDLLDTVIDDTRRIRARLASAERPLIDEYLASLEAVSRRQSMMVSMASALAAGRPELSDVYRSPHPLVRLEAQCEMAAAALGLGLTRVALIAAGCGNSNFNMRYTSLDPEIPPKHYFGHRGRYLDKGHDHWLSEIHHRHALCLATLIERLRAMPEAGGTVWDNTLVLYLADGGEKHHASFTDWPVVMLSGKNVPIRTARGGRSVIYPRIGSDGHRQLSNLWNTLFHAMGVPEDEFGNEGSLRVAPGPLPELLA